MSEDFLEAALAGATTRTLSVQDLFQAAQVLKLGARHRAVQALYATWITHNGDHPLSYAVMFNYAVTLTDSKDLPAAKDVLERAVALNPAFMPVRINLGRVHEGLGAPDQAVAQWSQVIDQLAPVTGTNLGHKTIALIQAARVLETAHRDAEAEAMLAQALELDRSQREAVQHFVALRQRQCKWPVLPPVEGMARAELAAGMSPLSAASFIDDPLYQLGLAWTYSRTDVGVPASAPHKCHPAAALPGRLRIGYLSSDLREHAVGYLMAEVFELHDHDQVEVFAYYCGPNSETSLQDRFKAAADHWIPVAGLDDAAVAQRMVDDGIQILVDVNGYTRDARNKLLALRPAPVIVNWLGYPGSTGSPFHNYIIADDWIIPAGHEAYYSEAVMRLPCYQPNDRQRVVSPRQFTREELGLPQDGTVFCCFNGTHKLTRIMFERWLTILREVPGSVLWLLSGGDAVDERLRQHAEALGISHARLVFAEKMGHAEHLARYCLADLFLDTAPYGAHTTASDALWMGTPVLTFSGRSFASRVCGSLVRAAGLPELVCADAADYVERAIALGRDRGALAVYRNRLLVDRDTCTLFDTPLLVRRLEDLYRGMWREHQDGRTPRPDLTNLDVYHELASQFDHESAGPQLERDYDGFWREMLLARDEYRPIHADWRVLGHRRRKPTRRPRLQEIDTLERPDAA
jgi:predicted O-linked N-acetylglucosamine transferase (SPINDLY family)